MDALIIAAGYGSRLASLSPSKPLVPIAGVPILEIGVRQAVRAGVRRVVVVTGHEAERVEAFLPGLSERIGVEIVAERLDDWSRPNGWSVMAGAARISGDYLLLMADHLFDHALLGRLIAHGSQSFGAVLAVDTQLQSALIDPEDATWVRRDPQGRIRAIGKSIAQPDAVDCGAFLATPALSAAIADSIRTGRPGSLSDGMQQLADEGLAGTLDVTGLWWMDVDDPAAHAQAEQLAPAQLAASFAG